MSIELSETGDVFIMTIGLGPNVWNPTLLDKLEEALDKVEKSNGPKALVITAKDKFFSNGLDLKYLSKAESNQIVELFGRISKVLARVLTFPMITVCAINGHAFGAGTSTTIRNNKTGAFLALACDYRLMKQDRGFFCFPEVDLGLPLSDTFKPLIQGKYTVRQATKAVLSGHRFTGKEAKENDLIDILVGDEDLLATATKLAQSLAPKGANRENMTALKKEIYEVAYNGLTSAKTGSESPAMKRFSKL